MLQDQSPTISMHIYTKCHEPVKRKTATAHKRILLAETPREKKGMTLNIEHFNCACASPENLKRKLTKTHNKPVVLYSRLISK